MGKKIIGAIVFGAIGIALNHWGQPMPGVFYMCCAANCVWSEDGV